MTGELRAESTRHPRPCRQTWQDEQIVFPVLLACMLSTFLLRAFGEMEWLVRVFYTIVILGAVLQVRHKRWLLVVSSAIALSATVMSFADIWTHENGHLASAVVLAYLAAFIFTALAILMRVLSHDKVTSATVSGALCVFLLMGIIWAFGYNLLERDFESRNHAFNGINKAQIYRDTAHDLLAAGKISHSLTFEADLEALIRFDTEDASAPQSSLPPASRRKIRRESYDRIDSLLFYFSYVTLTTLGYGDISPRSKKAQNLALLEAICGQMFLAVLIARLVGLHIATLTLSRANLDRDRD